MPMKHMNHKTKTDYDAFDQMRARHDALALAMKQVRYSLQRRQADIALQVVGSAIEKDRVGEYEGESPEPETQFRVRMFWKENDEEAILPFWPVITTNKRDAFVFACDENVGTYRTLETRLCLEWEPMEVPTAQQVRAMIDSGELQ